MFLDICKAACLTTSTIYHYELTSVVMKRRKQNKTRTAYVECTKLTDSVMTHGRFSYSGCKLPLTEPAFMA